MSHTNTGWRLDTEKPHIHRVVLLTDGCSGWGKVLMGCLERHEYGIVIRQILIHAKREKQITSDACQRDTCTQDRSCLFVLFRPESWAVQVPLLFQFWDGCCHSDYTYIQTNDSYYS